MKATQGLTLYKGHNSTCAVHKTRLSARARLRPAPVLQPRLLTVDQAAQILGRSAPAVRALLVNGTLKNASPDGRVQIDMKDIEVLISNSKR